MKQDKNMVALYVDKDTVNIYKASLDLYEACKMLVSKHGTSRAAVMAVKALSKAEGK